MKIFIYLLADYCDRIYMYIANNNIQFVDIFLKHITYSSICDALLKVQSYEIDVNSRQNFISVILY